MPLYTFALFLELERQAYVVDYKIAIGAQLMLLSLLILSGLSIRAPRQIGAPLVSIHSPRAARIAIAASLVIVFGATTLIISAMGAYTWGSRYILIIYIIPTILNIISGDAAGQTMPRLTETLISQSNAAPPAYLGALSGFTIIIGHKTGYDTFWPFVITLLMFTLHATFCTDHTERSPQSQLLWYVTGAAQAAAIMYFEI